MTVAVLNETFKGLADLKLRNIETGRLLHLPIPNNFVVENNIEERKQYSRTALGERTHVSVFTSGREPMLRISYSHMTAEIMAFRIGNTFKSGTKDVALNKSVTLVNTATLPPVTVTTQVGYGVLEDAPTVASVKRNYLSVPLTQVPFDDFAPETDDTFSVGAAMALKFSDNLLDEKQTISLQTVENMTTLSLSDNLVGTYSVLASLITTENKLVVFSAPQTAPSLAGSAIDFGADQVEIPLLLFTPQGACRPYEMDFTSRTVAC